MAADPSVGLSVAEVAERVRAGQTNDAPDPKSRSYASIIRENTLTSFNLVIGTMWVLMFVARAPFQDSLFGFIIVFNAAIGIVQETRAKRTLDRLSVLSESRPIVRRGGVEAEIPPREVVVDDIVLLHTGDQIIVDGEVCSTEGMEVDESLLTGEAEPVLKQVDEAVMSGSFVVSGSGTMRATQVGRDAYASQLTEAARKFTITHSELMDSIMKFVRTVTWVLIPLGILLFISQLESSPTWQQALSGTVAGVVTMVPEGLVLLTSVAMAVAVVRLGRRRTLVQQLAAVEVLARVDVVCLDKTGTLTEPGMAVGGFVALSAPESVEGVSVPVDVSQHAERVALAQQALGAIAASESNPNPTLTAVADAYVNPGWLASQLVPFSSSRRWSAGQFEGRGTWVLGAPESLLQPDSATGAAVIDTVNTLASSGARVLLLARGTDESASVLTGPGRLEPVALVAIDQRLRADAAETVSYFRAQGVELKVISGDNPTTVAAVARCAGIPGADNPLDASQLPTDPTELEEAVEAHSVFGRVAPEQKRALIAALQRRGHTVAMTGDGVNDVLALKDADLGIAMGSGSAATRSVAQLVLLDSKFAVLPAVVAEGRRVLGNIERVSDLFLTKSFYAALLSLMTVIFTLTGSYRVEFIFLPRHLTVITFLTIGTPAFFMALMPSTARFRPGFFARVLRFAVPGGVICAVTAFGCYLLVLSEGQELIAARTAAAITLFIVAWTVLVLVARPFNPLRAIIVAVMGVGFVVVLLTPALARFFALHLGLDSIGFTAVGLGVVGSAVLVVLRRWLDCPEKPA